MDNSIAGNGYPPLTVLDLTFPTARFGFLNLGSRAFEKIRWHAGSRRPQTKKTRIG